MDRLLNCVRRLFLVLALFAPGACERSATEAETPDLIVLQTGRLRGNVVPEGVKGSRSPQYYQFIAGYVKQVREEAALTNTPVLLLDLGDSLTGSFSASVTESGNVAAFFNALGYDAVMLGNLDSDLSTEALGKLQMPVLCPFATADGRPALVGTRFSTVLQKGGLEVQLLANFYGETARADNVAAFPLIFGDSEEVHPLRDYARLVKEMKKPDAQTLRVFTWLKFEHDLEREKPPKFFRALRELAVDFVAAHRVYASSRTDTWVATSRNQWEPPVSLNTLRSNRGFALARADLKRSRGKWVMLRQQVLPMVTNTVPADSAIVQKLQPLATEISRANRQIAYSENGLDEAGVLARNLEALASVPGTTLAMYSPNSVRASWPQRDIFLSDIYDSLPWPKRSKSIVQFELTEEQLAEVRSWNEFQFLASRDAPADQPWVVTTSYFLALEVAAKLGLDRAGLREVVDEPEYLFLADFVRRTTDPGAKAARPQGWEELPKP